MENDETTADLEQQENETQEVQEETQEQTQTEESSNEDDTDWKAEALKYKAILNRNKNKPQTHQRQTLPAGDMSQSDMMAILKSNIHEDDMVRVQKFAALEGISIRDALKSEDLKALLAIREEKRQTASASNVGTSKRGSGKIADDILLENFKSGTLPESDDDIARLVKLRSR